MNDYYDPRLKEYRLHQIESTTEKSTCKHIFIQGNLAEKSEIKDVKHVKTLLKHSVKYDVFLYEKVWMCE